MKQVVLVPNWLGDSVMCFAAVAALRAADPHGKMTIVGKPRVLGLWSLFDDSIPRIPFAPGPPGVIGVATRLRDGAYDRAIIFPHSFRAGLPPLLARIPQRRGRPGHARSWMLNDVVPAPKGLDLAHQSQEYLQMCNVSGPATFILKLQAELLDRCHASYPDGPRAWIALVPGASRGPAKRWPAEHFIALAGLLKTELNCGVVALGTDADAAVCAQITQAAGAWGLDFCGRTTVQELAAHLNLCAAAVTNDSGGMHLAAAVGTPVAAIFGQTDPAKTGPLGEGHIVIQTSKVQNRRIAAHDAEAEEALRRTSPEQVLESVRQILER